MIGVGRDRMKLSELQQKYYIKERNQRVELPPLPKKTSYDCAGGDRFAENQYGAQYDEYLPYWVGKNAVYVEIGILSGTGLAVIDEYLVNAKVYGFEYFLPYWFKNKDALIERGAFKNGEPEIVQYDTYGDNRELLDSIFGDTKINIVVDDADHSKQSMVKHMKDFLPYIDTENFLYIVEDCGYYKRTFKEFSDELGSVFHSCWPGEEREIRYYGNHNIQIFSSKLK